MCRAKARCTLIENGAVVVYPYSFRQLRLDNPNVSYPKDPDDEKLEEYGVVEVVETAKPAFNPITQNVEEGVPAEVGGVWQKTWIVVAASAEESANRQAAANFNTAREAVRLDTWVQTFLAMTPTEAQAFVNNNSANLAALRTNTARLAFMVNLLMRRELQE